MKRRLPSPLVWVPDEGQQYEIGQGVQWIREGNQSLIPDQLGPYVVESVQLDPGLLPERWLRVQLCPAN